MNDRPLRPLAGLVGLTWLLTAACGGGQRNTGQEPKTASAAAATASVSAPASAAAQPSAAAPTPTAAPTSTAAPEPASAVTIPPSELASLDALPPPDTDTGAKARRSLNLGESRSTIDPSSNAIPSLPTKIDAPPQAGFDSAIKAVPSTVPVGSLSKRTLEGPLRDRAHFEHCRIPHYTHGEIAAVVYNGAALGVDVKTTPNDRMLNFCIERAVRQMTWVKELAVNKVKVSF